MMSQPKAIAGDASGTVPRQESGGHSRRLIIALTVLLTLLVGLVYRWRRHWPSALIGGLLLAINPLHIWYSQEVRAYALMLLFGLLAMLAFELAQTTRKPWWWAVYCCSALTAIAVHKTGL